MGWSSRDSNLRRNNIPARKTKPVTPETPLTPVAPHNQTTVGGGAVDLSVLDDRSMKTVATLHANVQQSFRDWIAECQILIKAMGYEYKAISGNRSWDEQAKLYAQGRTLPGKKVTNAGPGYSNHNFGIAVDMGVFKEGKYVDENKPAEAELVHRKAADVAKKYNIAWGGSWSSFKDYPHFEYNTGKTLVQLRALVTEGKDIFS